MKLFLKVEIVGAALQEQKEGNIHLVDSCFLPCPASFFVFSAFLRPRVFLDSVENFLLPHP